MHNIYSYICIYMVYLLRRHTTSPEIAALKLKWATSLFQVWDHNMQACPWRPGSYSTFHPARQDVGLIRQFNLGPRTAALFGPGPGSRAQYAQATYFLMGKTRVAAYVAEGQRLQLVQLIFSRAKSKLSKWSKASNFILYLKNKVGSHLSPL